MLLAIIGEGASLLKNLSSLRDLGSIFLEFLSNSASSSKYLFLLISKGLRFFISFLITAITSPSDDFLLTFTFFFFSGIFDFILFASLSLLALSLVLATLLISKLTCTVSSKNLHFFLQK